MANVKVNDIMKGSNVTIDELSKFISKSGVIVKPHIGRIRRRVSLPKELLGSSANKKEDDEFFAEYINQGSLNLIPKSDEKKLIAIETSVRSKVAKLAIACDGTFMTSDVYAEEYLPYFNQKKVEFFEKRDEILAKWDILIDVFKTKLEAYLDRRNVTNKSAIMAEVINSIPSKSTFKDSFYMEVKLTAFPVEENIDMFSSTLAAQVKQSITDTKLEVVREMLGTLMGETFERVNAFLNFYYEKNIINEQQVKPLRTLKKNIIKNNILEHDLVKDIISELSILEKMPISTDDDYDNIAEQAENILVRTYGFMRDIGLDEYIKVDNLALDETAMAQLYLNINPNSVVANELTAIV